MIDPAAVVTCDGDLEAVVGAPPAPMMLKSIRFLDEHCERFLGHARAAIIGTTSASGGLQTIAVGGEPGLITPRSETVLDLGAASGDQLRDGAPASLIGFVPGYGETLRVNGRLRIEDGTALLDVDEALLHCAKAILRSELWSAEGAAERTDDEAAPTVEVFLADAPFVVLASIGAGGHTDVSPRGDPPGLIRRIDDTTIAIADRPGNRRTDSLHNLMDDPHVAVLALKPGGRHVAEVRGTAQVCTDGDLLASMRLRDRTPKAAIVIDIEQAEVRHEPALTAALWDQSHQVDKGALPRAATIWADHVRRNTDAGTGAKVARRLVNKTALAAGVAYDYRTNL